MRRPRFGSSSRNCRGGHKVAHQKEIISRGAAEDAELAFLPRCKGEMLAKRVEEARKEGEPQRTPRDTKDTKSPGAQSAPKSIFAIFVSPLCPLWFPSFPFPSSALHQFAVPSPASQRRNGMKNFTIPAVLAPPALDRSEPRPYVRGARLALPASECCHAFAYVGADILTR